MVSGRVTPARSGLAPRRLRPPTPVVPVTVARVGPRVVHTASVVTGTGTSAVAAAGPLTAPMRARPPASWAVEMAGHGVRGRPFPVRQRPAPSPLTTFSFFHFAASMLFLV